MIKLDFTLVKNFDVSFLQKWYPEDYNLYDLNSPSQKINNVVKGEHYKLLNFFSTLYKDCTLIDGGSKSGISALALGYNKNNKVISYDLHKVCPKYEVEYQNIHFVQKNILLEDKSVLLSAPLILLDLDPHDGIQETKFFELLRSINYKGLIILDDISTELTPKYFSGMKKFWDSIPEKKWDITLVGHGSGTGLVSFGVDIEVLL